MPDDFFEKYPEVEPPQMLYHYTNMKGLLGIIKDKTIWATNIFYLNDSAEYEYATGLIRAFAQKRLEELPPRPLLMKEEGEVALKRTFLDAIMSLHDNKLYHIYICSFSAHRDRLSQWRGYCPNESCFSLEFKTDELRAAKKGLGLVRCIYNKSQQDEMIANILQGYGAGAEDDIDRIMKLFTMIPQIKHESFEEESEWRLVLLLKDKNVKNVQFREGKSMIIPYIKIPLEGAEGPVKINRVTIGPTPHKQLSRDSVHVLLRKSGHKDCAVVESETPYRSW